MAAGVREIREEAAPARVNVLDGERINPRTESSGAILFHWPQN